MNGVLILDDLQARGLVHDSTDLDLLRARLEEGAITVYCGFDPTAVSLHVGNLVPLLLLRRFQEFGHRPIALAGGATGMIGDPGGRSEERTLLDRETLDHNLASIKRQLEQFLDFSEGGAEVVDNREWTEPLGVLSFLRDVGKNITVNTMLAKESVKARVESEAGISFTEFAYMLLQANDFWWLHEHRRCEMQVGGSDQWGNITAGIDLVRRRAHVSVHGLTVPLITRSDGQKFGKSQGENVWLDRDLTSPYRFFQYFMQIDDRDLPRLLLQLTLLPPPVVAEVVDDHRRSPEQRRGQRRLAWEVTTLVHGRDEADAAREAAQVLFGRSDQTPSSGALEALVGEVPTTEAVRLPIGLVELLAETGLASSKSDARRALQSREISLNNVRVGADRSLGPDDLLGDRFVLLRRGKKRYHLVVAASRA